jgi:hypothetical protein
MNTQSNCDENVTIEETIKDIVATLQQTASAQDKDIAIAALGW